VRDRAPEGLAVAAAVLAAAAGCVLLLGARRAGGEGARGESFQRLVGGLGSGAATSLVPCERAFDAGLSGACGCGTEPVPGGFAYCPHHAGASLRR
jgi:hypothetical protein